MGVKDILEEIGTKLKGWIEQQKEKKARKKHYERIKKYREEYEAERTPTAQPATSTTRPYTNGINRLIEALALKEPTTWNKTKTAALKLARIVTKTLNWIFIKPLTWGFKNFEGQEHRITKTILMLIFFVTVWTIQKITPFLENTNIITTAAFLITIYYILKIWELNGILQFFHMIWLMVLSFLGIPLILLAFATIKIPDFLPALPTGLLAFLTIILVGIIILAGDYPHKTWKWIVTAVYVLSIIIFFTAPQIYAGIFSVTISSNINRADISYVIDDVKKIATDIGDGFKEIISSIKRGYQREIALATGDYFTGMVDKKSKKKLGVFLTKIGSVAKVYGQKEPIDIFATLKAESIGTEPINITLTCYMDKPENKGTITPKSKIEVLQYEEEAIDCIIDKERDSGYHTIKLKAEFDFITSAYLKTYFMEKERLRAYKREQTDPLDAFKIKDKRPTTIYTQGPVMIGIGGTGLSKPPIGLQTERNTTGPTISITLENMWKGKIINFTKLEITVPEGINLEDINGKTDVLKCQPSQNSERKCWVDEEGLQKIFGMQETKIEDIRTFRIHTTITDFGKLMGEMPLAIKNIKVTAKYKYQIEKQIEIKVKKEK